MNKLIIQDEPQRQRALNPEQSFIVQAPAGSGKTELLAQRVLVLLSQVNTPEEILSITFTKKAASEMRARIIQALTKAQNEAEPLLAHDKKTWHLAKLALKRDEAKSWHLLSNPNQLRVQTIDSFNASLVKHLPILSHFGASPEITDDAFPLYREAVQEFLSHLEENVAWADSIAQLLLHMDNDLNKVQNLLVNMLSKRDQWLPYIMMNTDHVDLREHLESHLASVIVDTLTSIKAHFPPELSEELLILARYAASNLKLEQSDSDITHCADLTDLPTYSLTDKPYWLGISELLITQDGNLRKRLDKSIGFPAASSAKNSDEKNYFSDMKQRASNLIEQISTNEKFQKALFELRKTPYNHYQETQWQTLDALYQVLKIVVAQLKIVFQRHEKIDYIENAQAALFALGSDESPTDLALSLDYQINHILIDEFQDTSNSQYRLVEKLTAGWEPYDGRTLFVVGDPMQSIYRFREAEVGLFIRARQTGIGHIQLEPLTLSVNFRSTKTIVDWVNTHFQKVLPPYDDIATGAVSYSMSTACQKEEASSLVKLHQFLDDHRAQAAKIVQLILQEKQARPQDKIAILVRSRTHLASIIPALKKANIAYRSIKIDPLTTRPVIQDMMALTRALLHPADKIAWLAILRAPWCGLSLHDLLILTDSKTNRTLWEQCQQADLIAQLSLEGQSRLSRILAILMEKMAERRRYRVSVWVEYTWLALGGPACVEQASDLEDVAAYFRLLDQLEQGGDIDDLTYLEKEVSQLYAAPNNETDNSLQIMTIHNAKGLEFDTVILPHLERKSPSDEKQLLLWMERARENQRNSLILAPVHAIGDKNDAIYDYIKRQHVIKSDYETGRLLYVAATRAKKQLHLFLTLKTDENDNTEILKPTTKSLLEKLWAAIQHQMTPECLAAEKSNAMSTTETTARSIKRLSLSWSNPVHELASPEPSSRHQKAPGFLLSQYHLKYIGIVIHQILQQLSHLGLDWWQAKPQASHEAYVKNHLIQLGVLSADLDLACQTVLQAIHNMLKDPRGQWILQNHVEGQAELALTAVIDGEVKPLVIDRTFIDETGTRWIIDYKTAQLAEKDLAIFLAEEKEKYVKKMYQYQQAMQLLDQRPTRLGLYFPLLPAWLAWEF